MKAHSAYLTFSYLNKRSENIFGVLEVMYVDHSAIF